TVRNALRVGAKLLRELRRRFQLGLQRRRRSACLLLQLSQLNGQQCESLPDVVMKLAGDMRALFVLHPGQTVAKRPQLRLGLDPLGDVLVDAEAADEFV